MIKRADVLQPFLNMFKEPNYLEVGVCEGETFFELQAARKTAVDVHFRFDVPGAIAREPHSEFLEMTSDQFFEDPSRLDDKYDVVFLDGLHTFEQTLRDLINTLSRVKSTSIIVIDDILPDSYSASLQDMNLTHALNGWLKSPSGSWMGDVYKLVFFIDTFFQNLTYRTVLENHGQLVAWQKPRPASGLTHRMVEYVGRLPYERVAVESAVYRPAPLSDILAEVRNAFSPS